MTKISSSTEPKKGKERTKAAEKVQELPVRRSKRIAQRKLKRLNTEKKLEDPFEELFGEPIDKPDEKDYDGLVADLPDCRAVMKEDD